MNFAKVGVGIRREEHSLTFFLSLFHSLAVIPLCLSLTLLIFQYLTLSLSVSLAHSHSLTLSLSLFLSDSLTLSVLFVASLSLSLSLSFFSVARRPCYQKHAQRWFLKRFGKVVFSREGGFFGNKEHWTAPICTFTYL